MLNYEPVFPWENLVLLRLSVPPSTGVLGCRCLCLIKLNILLSASHSLLLAGWLMETVGMAFVKILISPSIHLSGQFQGAMRCLPNLYRIHTACRTLVGFCLSFKLQITITFRGNICHRPPSLLLRWNCKRPILLVLLGRKLFPTGIIIGPSRGGFGHLQADWPSIWVLFLLSH